MAAKQIFIAYISFFFFLSSLLTIYAAFKDGSAGRSQSERNITITAFFLIHRRNGLVEWYYLDVILDHFDTRFINLLLIKQKKSELLTIKWKKNVYYKNIT